MFITRPANPRARGGGVQEKRCTVKERTVVRGKKNGEGRKKSQKSGGKKFAAASKEYRSFPSERRG